MTKEDIENYGYTILDNKTKELKPTLSNEVSKKVNAIYLVRDKFNDTLLLVTFRKGATYFDGEELEFEEYPFKHGDKYLNRWIKDDMFY